MSKLVESLKRLYPDKVTDEKLKSMVEAKALTEDEYNEIVNIEK